MPYSAACLTRISVHAHTIHTPRTDENTHTIHTQTDKQILSGLVNLLWWQNRSPLVCTAALLDTGKLHTQTNTHSTRLQKQNPAPLTPNTHNHTHFVGGCCPCSAHAFIPLLTVWRLPSQPVGIPSLADISRFFSSFLSSPLSSSPPSPPRLTSSVGFPPCAVLPRHLGRLPLFPLHASPSVLVLNHSLSIHRNVIETSREKLAR